MISEKIDSEGRAHPAAASDPKLEAFRFHVEKPAVSHDAARRRSEQLFESNLVRIAAFMEEWERLKERATYGERHSRQVLR